MIKTRIIPALMMGAVVVPGMALPGAALAAGEEQIIKNISFSYEGPFGTFDRLQLQRGYQVFQEVCSGCHGLQYLAFRNLGDPDGPEFPDQQVKAIAAFYDVPSEPGEPFKDRDGENLVGELGLTRPGKPADNFPANTDADAPDLSLMAKARAGFHGPYGSGLSQLINGMGGGEYIYSVMSGYLDEPECAVDADMDGSYNTAFVPGGYPDSCKIFKEQADGTMKEIRRLVPGSWIAMPAPLYEDAVEYVMHGGEDGQAGDSPEATVEQMAEDISVFLMWAAEPKLVARKQAGLRNILMIIALTALLYFSNKALWAGIKRKG